MELGKDFKQQKEKYTTKVFWESFQTIFIFGIPAMIGAYIGLKIDKMYNTNRLFTIIILLATFIFSWTVVIIQYRKSNKELKELKETIKNNQSK